MVVEVILLLLVVLVVVVVGVSTDVVCCLIKPSTLSNEAVHMLSGEGECASER